MRKNEVREIVGYEGLYAIDTYGNVWNSNGYELHKTLSDKGYYVVSLSKNGKVKKCRIHRLVAETFIPNPENKPQVNHIDGNKLNNHISNLEWATPKENVRHAVDNGLLVIKQKEIKNHRFGSLVAVEPIGKTRNEKGKTRTLWKCVCDCGKTTIVRDNNLITGQVKSCGCKKGRKPKSIRYEKVHDKGETEIKLESATYIFRNINKLENMSDKEVTNAIDKTIAKYDYNDFSRIEMMEVIKWLVGYIRERLDILGEQRWREWLILIKL